MGDRKAPLAPNPEELRQVKVPRRIIAELDELKGGSYVPRWAVIEGLLKTRSEHLECGNDDPESASELTRGERDE